MALNVRLRGGSWFEASPVDASGFGLGVQTYGYSDVGFRCVEGCRGLWGRGGSGLSRSASTRARNRRGQTTSNRNPSDGLRCVRRTE